ncbi:MAG TPA: PQQ-dependent sugar dehydrogenase [bacterium]|nr:PQQ-dependent sugar dehydrogenase [bacterium]
MLRSKIASWFVLLFGTIAPACAQDRPPASDLPAIQLPPGFQMDYYAPHVPGARSMALSPGGTLFVGTRHEGKVYGLRDLDRDGRAEQVFTLASGLEQPNGVAFLDGALYVMEAHRLLRFDGIEAKLNSPPKPAVVKADFPTERQHSWKFVAFGPDRKLYVPIGAPCNVCKKEDPLFASITRLNPDGSGLEVFAHGVRNTVGFDWRPQDGVLWFTDNGRDRMGDDIPPDELNRAPRPGLNFGFPHCHGKSVVDPEFGPKDGCGRFVPPVAELGAHVAALGMRFYNGAMFPAEYRGQIFIAEHGSWNRSSKVGYRVTRVKLDGDRAVEYTPFAQGWLGPKGEVRGRPVDVLVMPDGALLVSDDQRGAIYRITYSKP